MPPIIEIESAAFENANIFETSAVSSVYREYRYSAIGKLGRAVLEPSFDPASVPTVLLEGIDSIDSTQVIKDVLAFESDRYSDEDKPLTNKLAELGLAEMGLAELDLSTAFVEDIRTQIGELPYGFEKLQEYRSALIQTPYLDLARGVQELFDSGETNWLDDAYQLVVAATEQFDSYALNSKDVNALYFVTYMPHQARSLTRKLIANSTRMAKTKEILGEITPDESMMLEALNGYMKSEILGPSTWGRSSKEGTMSEQSRLAIASATALEVESISTMTRMSMDHKGRRVIDAWCTSYEDISHVIDKEGWQNKGVKNWQAIDSGHGLSTTTNYTLFGLRSSWERELEDDYETPKLVKSGEGAVILEDDPSQLDEYASFVDTYSRFTVSEGSRFSSAEGITEAIQDTNNRLFILDMENGDDKTLGLRVAQNIMQAREALVKEQPEIPQTHIILWSASTELVELASTTLGAIMKQRENDKNTSNLYSYSLDGRGRSGGGSRIYIEVRLKGWNPNSFNFRHRDSSHSLA